MITIVTLFAFIGAIAGIMAGLFGIGGGVVIVPGLLFSFQQFNVEPSLIMRLATGTSLAAILITAFVSVYSHHQRKAVLWNVFWQLLPGLIIGTILGVLLADITPTRTLKIIFGSFLLVLAVRTFMLIKPKASRQLPNAKGTAFWGGIIGVASGLLGVGGGVITIPLLTHCNVPLPKASGTSAAVGIPIAIVGTITFMLVGMNVADLPKWSVGYVYWPAAIAIAIVSTFFVSVGAWLSLKINVTMARRLFAGFLAVTAISMIK